MLSTELKWPDANAVYEALAESWDIETSDEPEAWSSSNPSRGQCGASALVTNDWLGGRILLSKVYVDQRQIGYHYQNLLNSGELFDPTGDQFHAHEVVGKPAAVERTSVFPKYGISRYKVLSRRVRDILCR